MSSKIFYELDRVADSNRNDLVTGTVNGESVSNSLVFDKNRNSVWAKGVEYGIPGVESNNYEENEMFLADIIDDSDTTRNVQTFKGYGGVEYSLYVTPHGNLNIYGFIPIDITTLQSGKMNGLSFVQTNKISVEIGTNVSANLTHMKLLLNGSSVPVDGSTANSTVKELKISITGKMTATKDFTRSSNAAFLNAIRQTNIWSFSDLGITIPSGDSDLGKTIGTTSMSVQVWDIKNNTDTASITTMVEVYDKCYYFHDVEWSTTPTTLTYAEMAAKTGFTEWKTGNYPSSGRTTISSNSANTVDKHWYVLVPNRITTVALYQLGVRGTWDPSIQTINITNQSGVTSQYKVYKTSEYAWGGATNVNIVIS